MTPCRGRRGGCPRQLACRTADAARTRAPHRGPSAPRPGGGRATGAPCWGGRLEQLRLDAGVAVRPHVAPLRPHVYVDARVVPAEPLADEGRRLPRLRGRQLLPGLAEVALAVGLEIAIVDRGDALD